MLPKKVHVIHQLVCLFCSFKKYWFLREREKIYTICKPREAERKSKGMRNRFCRAEGKGSMSEFYISARPLGTAAVTVLWHRRHQSLLSTSLKALSEHPTPPQTPTLSHGLQLSDNHHQHSIYTCFTSSLYHFVLCIFVCLVGLWIPPFVIIQPRPSQRDEMKINSSPLPPLPLTTFLLLSRSCWHQLSTPSRTCNWTSGVIWSSVSSSCSQSLRLPPKSPVCNPPSRRWKPVTSYKPWWMQCYIL